MKIPQNILNNAWKIILLPASVAIINSVAGQLGYSFEFQKPPETEPSSNPPSATGINGGIHINNYPPQSPISKTSEQPSQQKSDQQDSSNIEESIKKELFTQNNTQEMGDGNINSPQNQGDNNTFSNFSETNNIGEQNNNEIQEQINNERNIETEQYNENNGSDITNCVRNNGTCGNNGTTYINPEN